MLNFISYDIIVVLIWPLICRISISLVFRMLFHCSFSVNRKTLVFHSEKVFMNIECLFWNSLWQNVSCISTFADIISTRMNVWHFLDIHKDISKTLGRFLRKLNTTKICMDDSQISLRLGQNEVFGSGSEMEGTMNTNLRIKKVLVIFGNDAFPKKSETKYKSHW